MSSAAIGISPDSVRPAENTRANLVPLCVAAVYSIVLIAIIPRHEAWADEAQAWLLARDASLWNLWTHLMHYEGSPGIWQTLLHIVVRIGVPYSAYHWIPGILAFAAVW